MAGSCHMSHRSMSLSPPFPPFPVDPPCGPTFTPTSLLYILGYRGACYFLSMGFGKQVNKNEKEWLLIICFQFFYIFGKQVNKNDTCYQGVA